MKYMRNDAFKFIENSKIPWPDIYEEFHQKTGYIHFGLFEIFEI